MNDAEIRAEIRRQLRYMAIDAVMVVLSIIAFVEVVNR